MHKSQYINENSIVGLLVEFTFLCSMILIKHLMNSVKQLLKEFEFIHSIA